MDKVKQFLRLALKHHFWILCVVLALATVGVWYMASGSLQEAFGKNKGVIDAAANPVQAIISEANPPNEEFKKRIQAEIDKSQVELAKNWGQKYADQAEILVWPVRSENQPIGLTADFVAEAKKLLPVEANVKFDAATTPGAAVVEPLNDSFRLQYQNYVDDALQGLANTVRAKWQPNPGAAGQGDQNNERLERSPDGRPAIVSWRGTSQSETLTRFTWTARPTTLEILYAQEDLWVLDALMKIIAKTNTDAAAAHHASVKEIVYLKVGPAAFGATGESGSVYIETPAEAVAAAPTAAPSSTAFPDAKEGDNATKAIPDPATGRYVFFDPTDKMLKPVLPDDLRKAMTGEVPTNPMLGPVLTLAKRIPIRMHLVIDQRKLNRLLAECCNSKLEIEVRQLRFNCPPFSAETASAGSTRTKSFSEAPASSGARARRGGANSDNKLNDGNSHDVHVELFGLAYLFNPVNPKLLPATTTAAPMTPAATTP